MANPPPAAKLSQSGIGVAAAPTGGMGLALDTDGHLPASVLPPLLTTWPTGTPSPGEEIRYVADSTNAVVWMFKYDPTQTTYKWVFVGGPPLSSEVDAGETTATTGSYVDLTTTGPSITVPRAGDYEVSFGLTPADSNNAALVINVSPKFGSSATADSDGVQWSHQAQGAGISNSVSLARTRHKAALAASDVVKVQYKTTVANQPTFNWRWLKIIPIRVS